MIPQTQLWVGLPEVLEQRAIVLGQELWCQNKYLAHADPSTQLPTVAKGYGGHSRMSETCMRSDNISAQCTTCAALMQKRHHAMCWISPEKNQYMKADIEGMVQRVAYMLEQDERLFFMIQDAELLSAACANSLLKLIEEPSQGYYFIFCARRQGMVLPTVVSRCVVYTFHEGNAPEHHVEFLDLFKYLDPVKLSIFTKIYEVSGITEQETSLLLDELVLFWQKLCRQSGHQNVRIYERSLAIIDVLMRSYRQMPMPGSAKMFWRNLFVQLMMVKS